MSAREELVKEVFADLRVRIVELADEVAGIAAEQDEALSELACQVGRLGDLCDSLRDVLGNVGAVSDLECLVGDVQSSVDGLKGLTERLQELNAPAITVAEADVGDIGAGDDGDVDSNG
jgi:hypothetical protein